jgi:hypothetical protein
MTEWIAKHVGLILLVGGALSIIIAVLAVLQIRREHRAETRITAVQTIGSPCRSAFAKGGLDAVRTDQQCTLQAKLIYTNLCQHHPELPDCAAIIPKLSRGVVANNGNSKSPSNPTGPSGGQHQTPPERPQEPVSQPRTPVPLGPLEQPVCSLTGALNVPICH